MPASIMSMPLTSQDSEKKSILVLEKPHQLSAFPKRPLTCGDRFVRHAWGVSFESPLESSRNLDLRSLEVENLERMLEGTIKSRCSCFVLTAVDGTLWSADTSSKTWSSVFSSAGRTVKFGNRTA